MPFARPRPRVIGNGGARGKGANMNRGATENGAATRPSLAPVTFAIEPDWIDYNGHLNMARYPIMFDRAIDGLMDRIGMPPIAGAGHALFALEAQLRYLREVHAEDRPIVTTDVLHFDAKRVHTFQRMRVGERDVATCENLHLCMLRTGEDAQAAPFPEAVLRSLSVLALPRSDWPAEVGVPIASRMVDP